MPLKHGSSKKVVSQNISEFHTGPTYEHTEAKFGKKRADAQAVAAALSTARKYGKKHGGKVKKGPLPWRYKTAKIKKYDEGGDTGGTYEGSPGEFGATTAEEAAVEANNAGALEAGMNPDAGNTGVGGIGSDTGSAASIGAGFSGPLGGDYTGDIGSGPGMNAPGADHSGDALEMAVNNSAGYAGLNAGAINAGNFSGNLGIPGNFGGYDVASLGKGDFGPMAPGVAAPPGVSSQNAYNSALDALSLAMSAPPGGYISGNISGIPTVADNAALSKGDFGVPALGKGDFGPMAPGLNSPFAGQPSGPLGGFYTSGSFDAPLNTTGYDFVSIDPSISLSAPNTFEDINGLQDAMAGRAGVPTVSDLANMPAAPPASAPSMPAAPPAAPPAISTPPATQPSVPSQPSQPATPPSISDMEKMGVFGPPGTSPGISPGNYGPSQGIPTTEMAALYGAYGGGPSMAPFINSFMAHGGRTKSALATARKYAKEREPADHEFHDFSKGGLINSSVPGRTDKLPLKVKSGSYVIPASVVSGLGEGNTQAGVDAINKLFKLGPYGAAIHTIGTPKINYGQPLRPMAKPPVAKLRASGGRAEAEKALPSDHELGMRVPKGGSMCANCRFLSGHRTCGNEHFIEWNGSEELPDPADEYCCDLYEHSEAKGRAEGGSADGNPDDPVKIIAAGGEVVLPPDVVSNLGGGNMNHGHAILDELVKHVRKQTIKDMQQERPPKTD